MIYFKIMSENKRKILANITDFFKSKSVKKAKKESQDKSAKMKKWKQKWPQFQRLKKSWRLAPQSGDDWFWEGNENNIDYRKDSEDSAEKRPKSGCRMTSSV